MPPPQTDDRKPSLTAAKNPRIRIRTDSEKSADSVADSESVTTLGKITPTNHQGLLSYAIIIILTHYCNSLLSHHRLSVVLMENKGHAKLRGRVLRVWRRMSGSSNSTVIRSNDAALKSCLEWLTMSYIISDSACLI